MFQSTSTGRNLGRYVLIDFSCHRYILLCCFPSFANDRRSNPVRSVVGPVESALSYRGASMFLANYLRPTIILCGRRAHRRFTVDTTLRTVSRLKTKLLGVVDSPVIPKRKETR